MSSEWMKVMLEEIARKKVDAEQAREEAQRRLEEAKPGADAPRPSVDPHGRG